MNIPIMRWPTMPLFNSSIQAIEHMTTPSFQQQSSTDYPVASIQGSSTQEDPSQAPEVPYCNDAICGSAGPYDDDGEAELDEEMKP
jgi:hypothetical protein